MSEWRKIGEALPRHGQAVLAFWPGGSDDFNRFRVVIFKDFTTGEDASFRRVWTDGTPLMEPTHWRPLPERPM